MLKKEITFTDLNGEERTFDYYFNMTRAEMLEYDAKFQQAGGILEYLQNLMKLQDSAKVMDVFRDLILRSYGEKTADGRFLKNQELRDAFYASEAYSELFMEILSGEEAAAAFINGIMPKPPKNAGNITPIPAPVG